MNDNRLPLQLPISSQNYLSKCHRMIPHLRLVAGNRKSELNLTCVPWSILWRGEMGLGSKK